MEGKPLEGTKNALSAALAKLDSKDSFNIIAFNGETYLFSSSMELASEETIKRAIQWINMNFIAGGSTNILPPLKQVVFHLRFGHVCVRRYKKKCPQPCKINYEG